MTYSWMREAHAEAMLLGNPCPFDCGPCDPNNSVEAEEYAWEQQEEDAREARRARREAARAEAIATGRTVKV